MNLFTKIHNKLNVKAVKPTASKKDSVKSLNKLPDKEKVKVLEYISSVKDLHKNLHE